MKHTLIITFLAISKLIFAQPFELESPIIQMNELNVKFNGILIIEDNKSVIVDSIADLFLELGETVQNITIEVINSNCTDVVIEQQYETSISISNEGPHLDLLNWKHFTSKWTEIKKTTKNSFISLSYSEKQEEKFPEFELEELINFTTKIGYSSYAELVKNPRFKDGSVHWWIGLSRISFRIKCKNKRGKSIIRQINFDIPMGC